MLNKSIAIWSGAGLLALFLLFGGGWIASLPKAPVSAAAAPPIGQAESGATIAALKPPKRKRPLIAIIGINDATETTDYLMPYGILRRANVADVISLATKAGPVSLYPVLKVQPDATVADFDRQHPDGADFVIVPAMSRDDDPDALRWIQDQATKGAIIIGVCAGAKVVGAAGLLDGKRATTHWYYLNDLRDRTPSIRYVADRRFVVDRQVATTTGISASMPMSLTLIEAIAGKARAESVAKDLGLATWDARHNSGAFRFNRSFALTVIGNSLAFLNRDRFGMRLQDGIDEVSLAIVADAWSRTYRSNVVTFAGKTGVIRARSGTRIVPDQVAVKWPAQQMLALGTLPPAETLRKTLRDIDARYGTPTGNIVAMQLEYPRNAAPR